MSILTGDCVEVMAGMEPDSIDAIVTDPPYGLGFMGKDWDTAKQLASVPPSNGRWPHGTLPGGKGQGAVQWDGLAYQAWTERWATEALRVAKPGAYLLAFGGTRTVHRLACALEDAGWVIRDTLVWAYAQGFPKSRSSLKPAWEPIIRARKPLSVPVQYVHETHHALAALIWLLEGSPEGHGCAATRASSLFAGSDTTGTSKSPGVGSTSLSIASSWSGILAASSGAGSRSTTSTTTRLTTALRTLLSCLSPVISASTMPRCECLADGPSSPAPSADDSSSAEWASRLATLKRSVPETAIEPTALAVAAVCASIAADLSADLEADGTAPRPATTSPVGRAELRPIVLARKPGPLRELDIDGCRIGTEPTTINNYRNGFDPKTNLNGLSQAGERYETRESAGRWPANVILTDPIFDGGWDGVVGGGEASYNPAGKFGDADTTHWLGARSDARDIFGYGDTGTYSRFFLVPKASRSDREPKVPGELEERERGRDNDTFADVRDPRMDRPTYRQARRNTHPTVKPTALMRHLIRLVTPEGGTVLDPFLGSGTTAKAAVLEGFDWVGIEREPEYVRIAEQRLVGLEPEPRQLEMTA